MAAMIFGRQTTRTGGLLMRSQCRDLIGDPRILTPCQNFSNRIASVQLYLTQIIRIRPGQGVRPSIVTGGHGQAFGAY